MKTFLKILGGLVGLIIVVALIAVVALTLKKPDQRPASTEKIERTPERLERGKYLVQHVAGCLVCHSDHENDRFSWPAKAGTEGQGGFEFDEKVGVPGAVCAQNITSDPEFGIGNWTDGEVVRAIREGVANDGHALFPQMPYQLMRNIGDEDVKSIVTFIRTLPPIKKPTPPVRIDFPVSLLMKLAPKPVEGPVPVPKSSDGIVYGKYLATMAGCFDCHTKLIKGNRPEELAFSGGFDFKMPFVHAISANITPDAETGIGNMTREAFIGRFKSFESLTELPKVTPSRQTVMPWKDYAGMTAEDLGAIYNYLRTVTPIKNKIVSFPDAT